MKSTLIKLAVVAILVITIIAQALLLRRQSSELDRLENNQSALLDSVSCYKAKNGQNAVSVQVLELTKKELEDHCSDLTEQVKNLNLKLRKTEAIAQAGTKTEVEVRTVIRDSVVYISNEPDTVWAFRWMDPWTDIDGLIIKDSIVANVMSRDTLTAVLHRKKKCLFKKAEYRLDITTSNPHSSLEYERVVKVTK